VKQGGGEADRPKGEKLDGRRRKTGTRGSNSGKIWVRQSIASVHTRQKSKPVLKRRVEGRDDTQEGKHETVQARAPQEE